MHHQHARIANKRDLSTRSRTGFSTTRAICVRSGNRERDAASRILRMSRKTATRGRKPDASSKSGKIRELLKTGMSPMDIAKKVGCTPALVYNVKARMAGPQKRGPGRPPKTAKSAKGGGTQLDGLSNLLAVVKGVEQERAMLRAALEKVQSVLAAALG